MLISFRSENVKSPYFEKKKSSEKQVLGRPRGSESQRFHAFIPSKFLRQIKHSIRRIQCTIYSFLLVTNFPVLETAIFLATLMLNCPELVMFHPSSVLRNTSACAPFRRRKETTEKKKRRSSSYSISSSRSIRRSSRRSSSRSSSSRGTAHA